MKTIGLKGIIPFSIKVIYLIGKSKMASTKGVTAYLEDKDFELWKLAVKKYKMDKSKLLKEIIHAWLFQNKLQLQNKNG